MFSFLYQLSEVSYINDWEISKCNNHTVLWTGRLSDEKNPVEAVEAFDFVIKAIPDAKLSILGTGDKRITAKVKAAIKDKKLNNSIIMQGFHKDVKQYYKNDVLDLRDQAYDPGTDQTEDHHGRICKRMHRYETGVTRKLFPHPC